MDIPHELYFCLSMLIDRSSIAKNYTKSFGDTSPEMLGIYRRFLNKMRKEYPDQSRQVLCLSKRIHSYSKSISRYGFNKKSEIICLLIENNNQLINIINNVK